MAKTALIDTVVAQRPRVGLSPPRPGAQGAAAIEAESVTGTSPGQPSHQGTLDELKGHTLLGRGGKGAEIAQLQELLKGVGLYQGGDEAGVFGPATLEAVRRFQKKETLLVDGEVGDQTWGALHGLVGRRKLEPGAKWVNVTPSHNHVHRHDGFDPIAASPGPLAPELEQGLDPAGAALELAGLDNASSSLVTPAELLRLGGTNIRG